MKHHPTCSTQCKLVGSTGGEGKKKQSNASYRQRGRENPSQALDAPAYCQGVSDNPLASPASFRTTFRLTGLDNSSSLYKQVVLVKYVRAWHACLLHHVQQIGLSASNSGTSFSSSSGIFFSSSSWLGNGTTSRGKYGIGWEKRPGARDLCNLACALKSSA